jgi:Domain of unknown function (DUF5703)
MPGHVGGRKRCGTIASFDMTDGSPLSRRVFLGATTAAAVAIAQDAGNPGLRDVISASDLVYERPVPRSEEGIPIGNGRMGSLVWTTPASLRFQINRVDVYANNSASNSFFERHNDYCGGCGFVDIEFNSEVFPEAGFRQHLSVYDGVLQITGRDAVVRVVAWPEQDVIAVQVETKLGIRAALRMLRYETKYFGDLEKLARDHANRVQTRNHTADSRLLIQGERIALTQEFREGEYCCKSAVALAVAGARTKAAFAGETEVRLDVSGAEQGFAVLIASAATFDPREDVARLAMRSLEAASTAGWTAVRSGSATWWHDFWSRGHVRLPRQPLIQQHYHYFLYLMAASSRGKFPPKFNGMLWNTGGDLRTWGAQHWYANTSCYYEALFAANRPELLDPLFSMYGGMYEAAATAARQQWGSQGVYIPETSYFDGLEKLPDDIAAEMRDLYLQRKRWDQRSQKFMEYAQTRHPHSSRWNWIGGGSYVNGRWVITERGSGPYGAVNHILSSTAKIAYYFWRRYEFTLDEAWLRTHAYPMLKGAVEFYRNYPNLKKGADGKYHIHGTNSNESVYGARDTDEDLSAMRGVTAALLRAAGILDADAGMQPLWREFLENLAPLPTSDDPDALKPEDYSGPRVFVRGRKPAVKAGGLLPDANSLPMWLFDLCNPESENFPTATTTFDSYFRNGIGADTAVSVLSKLAIAGALLGREEAVRYLIPAQIEVKRPERSTAYKDGGVLANRMTLREGPQALDAQRLGRAAEALELALLQSNPPAPGADPILRVFPAWPKEFDASFDLAARGAFLVQSSVKAGKIEFVKMQSLAGAQCRLRNPWAGDAMVGGRRMSGSLLVFPTRKGETIRVVPA